MSMGETPARSIECRQYAAAAMPATKTANLHVGAALEDEESIASAMRLLETFARRRGEKLALEHAPVEADQCHLTPLHALAVIFVAERRHERVGIRMHRLERRPDRLREPVGDVDVLQHTPIRLLEQCRIVALDVDEFGTAFDRDAALDHLFFYCYGDHREHHGRTG